MLISTFRKILLRDDGIVIAFSVGFVLIEIIPTLFGGYGYFIDEWYYIACARHLAFGYVDHPPLAPFLLRISMILFGDSLAAIRLLPAIAGGISVYLAGITAHELGGGKFAQGLACLATFISSVFLLIFGFFSVNSFELLFWIVCSYILVRILRGDDAKLWILFGLIFGLSLETKHTVVLLGAAVAIGLLLTSARKNLTLKEFWLGWTIVVALALPNLIWQYFNGWPSVEFYRNATIYKNISTPPFKVVADQVLLQNPLSLPVWLTGLISLLFMKERKQFRMIGWMYIALLALMIISRSSRPDRIAGIYPVLIAAGAVALEAFVLRQRVFWLKPVIAVLLAIGGIALAPLGLPILPPETLAKYVRVLGVVPKIESGKSSPLPQWFADRFDWEIVVKTVSKVYANLSPEDRSRAVIFASSYGHAGVLEFYGRRLGLPRVISNQNNYHSWGRGRADADVMIAIGGSRWDWLHVYAEVDSAAVIPGTYAMSWRLNMPVYIARKPIVPMNEVWDRIKHYE